MSACKDDLDEMMGRMKISSVQNADTQLKLDEQKATLDEVRSDIDQLKEKLEREQTQVQSRNRAGRKHLDKAISALAVTTTIFTLVVSGTIFVSVHDIATQAADLSRLLGNQIKKGKRTSSVLIRTVSSGAHSDIMALKEHRNLGVPTASKPEIDSVRNSPTRERQSQDLTIPSKKTWGCSRRHGTIRTDSPKERIRPQWVAISITQSALAASFDNFHRPSWFSLSNLKLRISVTVVITSGGANNCLIGIECPGNDLLFTSLKLLCL